jgi:enoyl-CoA hydratase
MGGDHMASPDDPLTVEIRNRVATVTLQRPGSLNALNRALWSRVATTFDELHLDDEVWVVVLTGAGDRAFCAGVDLKEAKDLAGSSVLPHRGEGRNAFEAVLECGKPVIAAVNGWAMGGGCELAMACDIRIAAGHARFGLPEAKRGMGANFGTQLLPRLIPLGLAYELLYTGDDIDATRAREIGLVNRVVPSGELLGEAQALAGRIAANAPLTVRRFKASIGRGLTLPVAAALRLDVGPNPYLSEDRIEGATALVEKRAPVWKAR